jgi:hypothetical protein
MDPEVFNSLPDFMQQEVLAAHNAEQAATQALPELSQVLCGAVRCGAVRCVAVLCCTKCAVRGCVGCFAVLCFAVLCCALLCCALLCCAVLHELGRARSLWV